MSRTIAITSGKGGVGKTSLAVNLAIQLAELGHRTCLFDADLGTANINILLGINPAYDIGEVVRGGKSLHDIIIRHHSGIDIIPGSTGVEEIANLGARRLDALVKALAAAGRYDYYLFDTSAGISRSVVAFCLAAAEIVLVVTHEPTSMTDAYALLKVLTKNRYDGRIRVAVNRCPDLTSAREVYKKFRMAVERYLGIKLEPLGLVFQDEAVCKALQHQEPLVQLYPRSQAAKCIKALAQRLTEAGAAQPEAEMTTFWNNCFHYFSLPLELPGASKGAPAPRPAPEEPAAGAPAEPEEERQAEPKAEPKAEPATESRDSASAPTAPEQAPLHPPVQEPDPARQPSPPAFDWKDRNEGEEAAPEDPAPLIRRLERLTESVSMLGHEMARFREFMESSAGREITRSGAEHKTPVRAEIYYLDLQAFMGRNAGARQEG